VSNAAAGWSLDVLYRSTTPSLLIRATVLAQGDHYQAEDLVHDVFADAWAQWDKVCRMRPESQQRWLFGVLVNKAVDTWRKIGRVDVTDVLEDLYEAGTADATYSQVACSLAWQRAWEIIQQMPPARHQVVCLRWLVGWSTNETSNELRITPSTVRVHLKNARDILIAEIGPAVPFLKDLPIDDEHAQKEVTP
jgi:RNA polymerase sigma-70 factor (ECF subfamily)